MKGVHSPFERNSLDFFADRGGKGFEFGIN